MKRLAARAAFLAVGCSCLLGFAVSVESADASTATATTTKSTATTTATPAKITVTATTLRPPPALPVTGASLIASDGQLLWSDNGSAELQIASTTKMMTFLVVLQHLKDLHTVLTQNDWRAQSADSQIGLQPGEQMSAINLLYALMVPSADDAAEDLAYNVGGGSLPRFIAWMNADAKALGLDHTRYATPIGLDTTGNYSSPDDLVHLGDYLMRKYALFRRVVHTYRTRIWNAGHTTSYSLENTDDLIARYPWIQGIKTGHTAAAGYVLVSQGKRDGLTLIASVLGTDSEYERDESTLELLDWGFANFVKATPVRAHEVFARSSVPYEVLPAVVAAARGYTTVIARGSKVKVSVGRLRALTPPMAAGTRVGYLTVRIAGRARVRVPLVLARALPSVPATKKIVHLLLRPITLLLLGVLVAAIASTLALRIRRRRRRNQRRSRVRATRHLEER